MIVCGLFGGLNRIFGGLFRNLIVISNFFFCVFVVIFFFVLG